MMTSADKVGGWVKKGQNHDDVILEWSLSKRQKSKSSDCSMNKILSCSTYTEMPKSKLIKISYV